MGDKVTEKEELTLKIKVEKEVTVPPDFCEMVLRFGDVFDHGYIGYWANGFRVKGVEDVWAVVEYESRDEALEEVPDDERRAGLAKVDGRGIGPRIVLAKLGREYRLDELPLPILHEYYHVLDLEAVGRAVKYGMENFSLDFCEQYDGDSLDVALQYALLGEHRYA
jgi:hypothetical protein